MEDLDGSLGAHDCDLGGRPGEHQVVADVPGVHDDVRPAVRLAQDDADPRHGGPGVGERHLGPVADHAPPLEVLAGVEARGVDEGDEGQVESVAEGHESASLLGGGDVEGAGHRLGLVGDDADGPATDRREGGDQVRGECGPGLEQVPVVNDALDHVPDVVAARGGVGEEVAGLGGRAVDGIDAWNRCGERVCMVGKEVEEFGDQLDGLVTVGDGEVGDTRRARVHRSSAEAFVAQLLASEPLDHLRAAHEGVGLVDHHHQVGEAEEERRAGHGEPVHAEDHRDDARAGYELAGGGAPPVDGGHALGQVGPARRHEADQRDTELACRSGGDRQVLAVLGTQGAAVLPTDLDHHHPAAAKFIEAEGDGASRAGPQVQGRPRGIDCGHFVPPGWGVGSSVIVTWIPG